MRGRNRYYEMTSSAKAQLIAWGLMAGDEWRHEYFVVMAASERVSANSLKEVSLSAMAYN